MRFPAASGILALLTDFGLSDHYVGVMKGVALSIFPDAKLVDLSHGVEAYSVEQGAFFLEQGWLRFPPGTVFCAVVDPGVGTARRALAGLCEERYVIAPDNGLASRAFEGRETQVRELDAERFGLTPMSATFHGRDLFAPAAAWLASGRSFADFGEPIEDWVRLWPARPSPHEARVVNVDRFGNVVTGFREGELPEGAAVQVGGRKVTARARTYGEAPGDEPFLLVGSSGYWEISMRQRSAAEELGLTIGDSLYLSR
ncbi:MAG: SAM-dependent chlorinase/fluorinase [Acidobacteria bacterium]|nr:SAM-dependent chlorinase/fluorinase [Acidobacteriota bacterium]